MERYSKLNGTTADNFKIGEYNNRYSVHGQTSSSASVELVTKNQISPLIDRSGFFVARVIAKASGVSAAFEIKGGFDFETEEVFGNFVDTYVNNGNFQEPVVSISNNQLIITCTGIDQTLVEWSSTVDLILI